jgi:hypothetical protein
MVGQKISKKYLKNEGKLKDRMESRHKKDEKTRPGCNLQVTNGLNHGNARIHHKNKQDYNECSFCNVRLTTCYGTAKKQRRRAKEPTSELTSGTRQKTEW